MDILFSNGKLEKECNTQKLLIRRHGPLRAKILMKRLTELKAIETLGQVRTFPQYHCHELTGNRLGQLAISLDQPYRLVFQVANDPIPMKPDGGLDWSKVTAIKILEVVDYHE